MNESSTQYNVIFTGNIDPSIDQSSLKLKLQNRYQLSEKAMTLFFQNRELVIESDLSEIKAKKLYDELQQWGMEIQLVASSESLQSLKNNSDKINHLIAHCSSKSSSNIEIQQPRIWSFDFAGRYNSSHFFRAITLQTLLSVLLFIFAIFMPDHELIDAIYGILLLMWGFWVIRSIVLRLHDFDQNNTSIQIIAAIPIVFAFLGLFFLSVLFYLPLLWKKGTDGKNRFGLPVKPLSALQKILSLGYYLISLFIMLLIALYISDQQHTIYF